MPGHTGLSFFVPQFGHSWPQAAWLERPGKLGLGSLAPNHVTVPVYECPTEAC